MTASAIKHSNTYKVISLIFISLILVSCGAGRTSVTRKKSASATLPEEVVDFGKKYLGKPYRYAARGPRAFDCSGYTAFVFKEFGYNLNPSSAGQHQQFPAVSRKEDLQKGDLVFFEGRRKNGKVGHVGIITETLPNGTFRFIHASTGNGVTITSSSDIYWRSRYLRGGRILEENTLAQTNKIRAREKKDNRFTPAALKDAPGKIVAPVITPMVEDEITAIETALKKGSETTSTSEQEKEGEVSEEVVILVQHYPSKNAPLKEQKSPEERNNDTDYQTNSVVIVREDSIEVPEPLLVEKEVKAQASHTVKMGETLYSISRQYNCTVEKLKSWNPQLGEILKVGDLIRISD
ncbi:MAG: LysM peptidoglycan-binding domain-containing protein [Bacteroidales bacterium]|jgi:LysM repeat protein|nr:LysM peptidoglycan-binding domain-containing protein [Bacteroidales bacterium]